VRNVRCSAVAKCLILIPLHEDICKDYGFFEAGAEMQSPHNNPITFNFFIGAEHSEERGKVVVIHSICLSSSSIDHLAISFAIFFLDINVLAIVFSMEAMLIRS
jgi:hypothetical protein